MRRSICFYPGVLFLLFAIASSALAADYNFADLGAASGGFKPQGNRFLVSQTFTNDDTSMYYDDGTNETVSGMVVKPDGANLTSFDLGDMTVSPYDGNYVISITLTADLQAGGSTSTTATMYNLTAPTALTAMGMNFSAFNDVTELRIDLTVHGSLIYNVNFDTISINDEKTPVTPGITPTVQATSLSVASNGTAEINFYWQNGNGTRRIVFIKQGNTGTPTVTDGTEYQADTDFSTATDIGGGWKCVFRDIGYIATATGLDAGTVYRVVVYEFDGTGGGEAYLTSIGTNIINHATSSATIDKRDFSSLGAVSDGFKPQGNRYLVSEAFKNDETSMYYDVSDATASGIVIKPNSTSLLSFDLVDLEFNPYDADRVITVTVTADLKAGGTTSQTVTNFTMYHGMPYSLSLMGMDFSGFDDVTELRFDMATDAVNNINFDTITISDPDEFVMGVEPTVQATNLQVAGTGTSVMNVFWQNGNGTTRIVFASQGSTGTPPVADGTEYEANADFSAAADIGGGWKCVYQGNGSYSGISGLTAGTPYRFVVYELDGSGGGENYLTTIGTNVVNHATDPIGLTKYDFSALGAAAGGFKPQGDRFLVSETFINDGTSIYYNSSDETVNGMVIKPDTINLTLFDLVDLELSPFNADRIVSITVTADLAAGGSTSQSVSDFSMFNGMFYSLALMGFDFSAFDDVTELRFDITVADGSVNVLNFNNITLTDQRAPGTPPTVATQAITGITTATATGNGTITDLGTTDPLAHGVCWNSTGNPTTADSASDEGAASATGAFTSGLSGLSPNTTYYVRAYATNAAGTSYGVQVSFTTNPASPTVTTQAASGIGATTATGNGIVTDLGAPDPTAHGVCWNTDGNPTTADSASDEGAASATGAFTSGLSGLSPNTTYYVRAYATNTAGTSYGAQVSFTTNPASPTVTTQAASGIGATTATGNGIVTDLGAPDPTAHGVCWNTNGNPTTADSASDEGAASATGTFTSGLSGLSPNTTYYARAYATNTAGTSYGAQVSFTTASLVTPTITTQAVSAIATTTATGSGTITDLGMPDPTAHGVCWNTTGNPTTADSATDEGAVSVTGAFSSGLSGLSPNTTYYVRAYATNAAGTSYGAQVSFKTDVHLTLALTPSSSGVTTPAAGSTVSVETGVAQTITASATTGYRFAYWTAAPAGNATFGNSASTATTVTLNDSATITAVFTVLKTYTLAYAAGPNGTISGITPQTVAQGSDGAAVEGVPDPGFHFVNWSDGLTANPRRDTNISGNISATAHFEANSYSLFVGSGVGSGDYPCQHVVTISADTPPDGQVFDQWIGDTDNVANIYQPNTTVTIPAADTAITATFKDPGVTLYPLTVIAGTGSGDWLPGQVVSLSAETAVPGQVFDQWTGDTDAIANIHLPDTILIMPEAATSVTAVFKAQGATTYHLTVAAGAGSGDYLAGEVVDLSADAASPGQVFDQWTGDTAAIANINLPESILVMPSAAAMVRATYKDIPAMDYLLTVVNGTGSGRYFPGETVVVSALIPEGHTFETWTGQNAWLSNVFQPDTTLIMPESDITLSAVFAIKSYRLVYLAGNGGRIAGTTPQIVNHGADGTPVSAVPDDGYQFVRWSDGVATAARTETGIAGDINVTAQFVADVISDEDLPADMDLDGNGTPDRDQSDIRVVSDEFGDVYFGVVAPDDSLLETLEWIDPSTVADMTNRPGDFPLGLLTFRVSTAFPGEMIELTIYCSEPIPQGTLWYKHDPVSGWYDFSAYTDISQDRMSLTLSLQDGGAGDADGIVNAVIEDPSGPAWFDGDETGDIDSHGGSGGCFIRTLLHPAAE